MEIITMVIIEKVTEVNPRAMWNTFQRMNSKLKKMITPRSKCEIWSRATLIDRCSEKKRKNQRVHQSQLLEEEPLNLTTSLTVKMNFQISKSARELQARKDPLQDVQLQRDHHQRDEMCISRSHLLRGTTLENIEQSERLALPFMCYDLLMTVRRIEISSILNLSKG